MLLFYNCYKTVSGHFFAICIFIFHKTEVQTVILRCLTGLNCNWFKSYGLRCSWRLRAISVNFWKISSDKWPLYDHIWPFFRNTWLSLTKLRFIRSFWGAGQVYILIGTKVMTQNPKTQKTQICVFVQNHKKMGMEIFAFCCIWGHNFWTN